MHYDFLRKSEIREMSIACDAVCGINLSQGICDFPINDVLKRGVCDAMEAGYNHYTRHDGEYVLRKAIAQKASKYNVIEADPEKNIIVTCGTTGALFCVCKALLSQGDEVILFEPFYGYHDYTLKSLGLQPVYVRLEPPEWQLDINLLLQHITNRTKAIIINTPLNPTGKVFSREELQELAHICQVHNLLVITDEIYEYILYDGRKHISPASLPEFKDRVITISGYSKTFSITGWRIGYCICPECYTTDIGYVADLLYVCAPAPLQWGVAEAINSLDDNFYNKLAKDFDAKRSMICKTLTDIGLTPNIPQGAYYVMADISKLPGITSKEKVMWLLNKSKVADVPGEAFYQKPEDGYNLARFCFAKDDDTLRKACDALMRAMKEDLS